MNPPPRVGTADDAPRAKGRHWVQALAPWVDPKLLVPFLQAIVVILVGWGVKDSVDTAMKQRELDLANVREMRELLRDLLKPDLDLEEYQAAAVALAPFQSYSTVPFLNLMEDGTDNQALAAAMGLRVVATANPRLVSDMLLRIIRNRTGFYTWNTHFFAIRTLGEMGDPRALGALEIYDRALGAQPSDSLNLSAFQAMVRRDKKPSKLQWEAVREAAGKSIGALRIAKEEGHE